MAEVQTDVIPFGPLLETSAEEIAGAAPEAYNIVVDSRGAIRKRPGIVAYTGVAPDTAVDAGGILGLYLTEPKVSHVSGTPTPDGVHPGVLYAVGALVNAAGGGSNEGRNVYRLQGGVATQVGSGAANENRLVVGYTAGTSALIGSRPVFAETEALLLIACGAEIARIDIRPELYADPNFSDNADYHEMQFLGGDPPFATHIVGNSSRILANDIQLDQTKVRYSDISQGIVSVAGHESWTPSPGAAGFFTAEARPDAIIAIAENTNDIFVFGRTSLQLFSPDGSTTFAPSVTRELGCLAPYGVVKVDDRFAWVDHLNRIVISDGRSWEDIGAPLQTLLDSIIGITDRFFSYRFTDGSVDAIVFATSDPDIGSFNLAYQPKIGWSRWTSGFPETEEPDIDPFGQFPVTAHLLRNDGGVNVVGLFDGTVRLLSLDANSDMGSPITALMRTGFLDRKSDQLKHCLAARFVFKRTRPLSEGVTCTIEYRDDLSDNWTTIEVELHVDDGDLNPVITLRSLGTYRRRQWRFTFGETAGFYLVRATEQFVVLDS